MRIHRVGLLVLPFAAALAVGCGAPASTEDAMEESTPLIRRPWPAPVPIPLPAYPYHDRNDCVVASGSSVSTARTSIVNGNPVSAPLGYNCVESGHGGAVANVVYTDVDNPRIWTQATIGSVTTGSGTHVQAYSRYGNVMRGDWVDMRAVIEGGNGGPLAGNLAGNASSLTDTLTPFTATEGTWSRSVLTMTSGMRVGVTPVDFTMCADDPNYQRQYAGLVSHVALDPGVFLVPVQVVVFTNATTPVGVHDLASELMTFDRVPTQTALSTASDLTQRKLTARTFAAIVDQGETRPQVSNGSYAAPDDVWGECGVQFRLVNHFIMTVGTNLTSPPDSLDIKSALYDMMHAVQADPRFNPGVLTVLYAPHCTSVGKGSGAIGEPAGQTLIGDNFVCVASGSDGVLSHEIGHVLTGSSFHPDCTVASNLDNVMCATDPGTKVDPYAQCTTVRNNLQYKSLVKYFH